MVVLIKHKLLISAIILLMFIAIGAWHSEDMLNAWWAMWTVPIIFLGVWLLFDCIFADDKSFIFDHDYEVGSTWHYRFHFLSVNFASRSPLPVNVYIERSSSSRTPL